MAWLRLNKVLENARMLDGNRIIVCEQILLGNVGLVAARLVLSEQVIERLVLRRADFGGDGFVPFFRVCVLRVYVIDHASEAKEAM